MVAAERVRIDKWLWQARFFKTRSLAAALVSGRKLRLNGVKMAKPGHAVGPGDVLTFPQAGAIRVIRVLAPGCRRGPASEARTLYEDLAPPAAETGPEAGPGAEQSSPRR